MRPSMACVLATAHDSDFPLGRHGVATYHAAAFFMTHHRRPALTATPPAPGHVILPQDFFLEEKRSPNRAQVLAYRPW